VSVTEHLGALGALEPVGLDALTATADLQTRRDRKYLVPPESIDRILADSGCGMRVLTIDDAWIFRYESMYFDTVELASYLGAARGRPQRFKVRTRSYLDAGSCLLEVKTRDPHGLTVKHRNPHDIERRGELTADGLAFVATIPAAAANVAELVPTLTSAYRRSTLLLVETGARVTVDLGLTWRRPDGSSTTIPDLAIIETKTPGRPCPVDHALWRCGQRPVSFSKYCTGLAALFPHLPANRWHRVLGRHFPPRAAGRA
jgi:hypothetical protein